MSASEEEVKGNTGIIALGMLRVSQALRGGLLGPACEAALPPLIPVSTPVCVSLWLAGSEEESRGRISHRGKLLYSASSKKVVL